jgi:RNA methyltransferase, TrmH family
VVEGPELLSVALDAGATVEAVYVAPEGRANDGVGAVVDRAFSAGVRVFDLGPGVIERVSDTVHPQPVLAVVGFTPAPLEAARDHNTVMVLVDVRDPGNAGTMIRTADASGVGVVIHCDGSVDPTNPKVVRSSAGSIFHVPVVFGGDPTAVVEALQRWEFTTVGTAVRDGTDYASFDWRRRVALVFGNEASGLDETLMSRLDARVSVPMVGKAESLNVAVSASVLCFEALRQRRRTADGPGSGRGTESVGVRSTISDMETAHEVPEAPAGSETDHG